MSLDKYYILVVDDQAGVRFLLSEALTEDGYIVELATNGEEAIEKIRSKIPSLILLDLMMPQMGGIETVNHFKKLLPNIPIIVITAYYEMDTLMKVLDFEQVVNNFIKKPFNLDEVRHLIKDTLAANITIQSVS